MTESHAPFPSSAEPVTVEAVVPRAAQPGGAQPGGAQLATGQPATPQPGANESGAEQSQAVAPQADHSSAGANVCPTCGASAGADADSCELCQAGSSAALVSGTGTGTGSGTGTGTGTGSGTGVASGCLDCAEAGVTAEGNCESCGRRLPPSTDHREFELDLLAGVTDRGLRHSRNEDAVATPTPRPADGQPVAVAVVCDGVSTSSRPDEAAHQAASSAIEVLVSAVRASADPEAASADAFLAAKQALIAMAPAGRSAGGAPSATFVSAIVTSREVILCWLGDSRAYWLDASDPTQTRQLSRDDSVAQELVARGLLSEPDALASPAGHVITGWIGADLRDAEPHVATFTPAGRGVLLLCTDGLWNYQPGAAELAAMALPAALTGPLGAAKALVEFALAAGGGDNVTVVLAPFPAQGRVAVAIDDGLAKTDDTRPDQKADTRATVPWAAVMHPAATEPGAAQAGNIYGDTVAAPILRAETVQAPVLSLSAETIEAPIHRADTILAPIPPADESAAGEPS